MPLHSNPAGFPSQSASSLQTAKARKPNLLRPVLEPHTLAFLALGQVFKDIPQAFHSNAPQAPLGRAGALVMQDHLGGTGFIIGHNFDHGSRHLSLNFFALNLLAFLIHQILELCDLNYQYCRSRFSSRQE
jgi:hypothetical protein